MRLETHRGVSFCAPVWRAEGSPGPADPVLPDTPSLAAGTARGRDGTPARCPESCGRGWGVGLRVPLPCHLPYGAMLPRPPAPQPCWQPFPCWAGGAGVSTHNMRPW